MQVLLPGEAPQPAEGQSAPALSRLRLSATGPSLLPALVLALLSGLILSLSLPPAGLGPVAFVAPIPLLWLVRTARPRRGFLLGLIFGVGYFGALLYWISLFGILAWSALVLASAAFVGVFGTLAPLLWRERHPVASSAAMAAAWTALEWIRGRWPLGGFAWGQLGSTQTGDPPLLRLASITGVWGLSFVVLLGAGVLLLALERARRRPATAALLTASVLGLALAPGAIPLLQPDGRALRIATIQLDVRRAGGADPAAVDRAVAAMNVAMQQRLASDPTDLAVWGEGALDPGAWTDRVAMAQVRAAIASVGVPTLSGAVTVSPTGIERTEAVLFEGDGRIAARYAKVHLVPFGEYVPWRSELSWISALRQVPVDRKPGDRIAALRTASLPAFGTPICFENGFPSIERSFVLDGAGFFVLTINDSSYGTTAASAQQVVMSQLRAAETARWVVHAAISGESAFIDPSGRVVARTGLFVPEVFRHTIRASDRLTLYVRLGDVFPAMCLAFAAGFLLLPRRRRLLEPPPALPERPRTLVILPTFNEARTVADIVEGVLAAGPGIDVLVVDDGSPDGTGSIVEAIAAREPRVRLLERPSKAGLASAYGLGFRRALQEGYDLVVEMDSDLSHDPAELPGLLSASARADLVVGSRYVVGGSVSNWSRGRVALSRGGNAYARLALGFPVRDATSGYRVFRRRLLEHLVADPIRSEGYGFQIELVYRAWRDGFAVAETPITFRERTHGASKMSRAIVFEALWLVTVWGLRARLTPSSTSPSRGTEPA